MDRFIDNLTFFVDTLPNNYQPWRKSRKEMLTAGEKYA